MQKLKHETTPYHEAYRGQNIFFLEFSHLKLMRKKRILKIDFFSFNLKIQCCMKNESIRSSQGL